MIGPLVSFVGRTGMEKVSACKRRWERKGEKKKRDRMGKGEPKAIDDH